MLFLSGAKFFRAVFSIWHSREAQINEKEAMTKFWIRPNWWVQPEEWEVLGGRGAGPSHRHPDHRDRGQESAEHAGGLQEQVWRQVRLQAFFPTQRNLAYFRALHKNLFSMKNSIYLASEIRYVRCLVNKNLIKTEFQLVVCPSSEGFIEKKVKEKNSQKL